MTTILYSHKHKQIVIDSRRTAGGDIVSEKYDKTIKVDDDLWFVSGSVSEVNNFIKHKQNDKIDSQFHCRAILLRSRQVFLAVNVDGFMSIELVTHNIATGSGAYYAECALDFGTTAKEAVEYAITKDCYSGGKVRVFNLDGKEVE